MAIKIIEAPLDQLVVKRTPCGNCGVTLEYTPADTTQRMVRDYTGSGEMERFLQCPKCNHEIRLGAV